MDQGAAVETETGPQPPEASADLVPAEKPAEPGRSPLFIIGLALGGLALAGLGFALLQKLRRDMEQAEAAARLGVSAEDLRRAQEPIVMTGPPGHATMPVIDEGALRDEVEVDLEGRVVSWHAPDSQPEVATNGNEPVRVGSPADVTLGSGEESEQE